ncbi:M48 family metallopeptidase [Ruegeria atlantica]|uniref:TPR repeat-containing protein YfgC n=1 Tax=Ruegeria atlantica TaxID=81569 RepID=A0A0P1EAS2_9RHOB|nr:M48 family metallopeptidase [Ruegeria atlantica]CUH45682.1 TPR repeat-containing protein YfgC precursor [Ruegeria atlantica]
MRRLICLFLSLLLAACSANSLRVQTAAEWAQEVQEFKAEAEMFQQVSRQVGEQARKECLRRSNVTNCEFTALVDLNPNAQANAFQTLDNKKQPVIIFTRALIESADNADELAFVMGHEAAHHILRHIPRQSKNARDSAAIFGELARLGGADGAGIEEAQKLGAEVGAQVYIKDFELEADQLGTIITFNAGYNPLIGAKYFERIPDPGDQFLGTHPPNAQRVKMVRNTAQQLGLTQ